MLIKYFVKANKILCLFISLFEDVATVSHNEGVTIETEHLKLQTLNIPE